MGLLLFNLIYVFSLLKLVLEFLKVFLQILLEVHQNLFTRRTQFKVNVTTEQGKLGSGKHSMLLWLST